MSLSHKDRVILLITGERIHKWMSLSTNKRIRYTVHDWTGSSRGETLKLLVHQGTRLLAHKMDEFITKFISPQVNEFEMNE